MLTMGTLRGERSEAILGFARRVWPNGTGLAKRHGFGQARLAKRHGARSLRVFGSVARGEGNENSALDLLVEWEPGRSLMDHAALVPDLEDLPGVKVHIGTEKSLHGYVRDRMLHEATPL
jgi:predicted nucleotidyltransferase